GEDYLVQSEDGTYAANLERAEVAPLSGGSTGSANNLPSYQGGTQGGSSGGNAQLKEVHTPGLKTIDEISAFLKCTPQQMIKTMIFEGDGEPLVALVRGDHEVNESKLRRVAGVKKMSPAEPDLIRKVTGADVGFAGPVGLKSRIVADPAVIIMRDAVTGANK